MVSKASTTTEVRNLRDFMAAIEGISAVGTTWYRGVGKASYALVPGLYRHPRMKKVEDAIALEAVILQRFRERSAPYLTRDLANDWEYLFFMQHYRVPTRLLDWTESAFVALYFALTSAPRKRKAGKAVYEEPVGVWALHPETWNEHALSTPPEYSRRVLSVQSEQDQGLLSGHKPRVPANEIGKTPVAMYGTHNSQRIVAQKGTFVIFGSELRGMEEARPPNLPQDCLQKITVPQTHIGAMIDALPTVGATDSVVFPDLDGLAKELSRVLGFEV